MLSLIILLLLSLLLLLLLLFLIQLHIQVAGGVMMTEETPSSSPHYSLPSAFVAGNFHFLLHH